MKIIRPPSNQPIPQSAKKVFSGVLFNVYQWEQPLFDGQLATYEKIQRRDTVSVFPITSHNKILLCRQEQPGTLPFIGSLGGQIDEGESPLEAAKRELLEESGYAAKDYTLWHAHQPFQKIDWAVYAFIAKNISRIQAQKLEAGERIELIEVTFAELLKLSLEPEFRDKEFTLQLLTAEKQGRLKEIQKLFSL